MSTEETISVAVEPEIAAELGDAVEGGEYASIGAILSEHLAQWRSRRMADALKTEELRGLVQEAIDSGPGIPADDVFEYLREKIRRHAAR